MLPLTPDRRRHTFTLTVDVPETVSIAELKSYMTDAVEYWGGQKHPAYHLFGSAKVRRMVHTGRRYTPPPATTRDYWEWFNRIMEEG